MSTKLGSLYSVCACEKCPSNTVVGCPLFMELFLSIKMNGRTVGIFSVHYVVDVNY